MPNINMIISLLNSFIFFFIVSKFPTLSFATTNETDLQALRDIKNHIHNDPFQVLNSWNDSIYFCKWKGITCGKRQRRVIILDVSSFGLVGTLSPYVGNLTFLQQIDLSNNSFHGTIPQEIGKLFLLRSIVFTDNAFNKQFPLNLTLCRNLRVIDLSRNQLSGRIPYQLSSLFRLKTLALAENNFTGHIPPSLGNISTLQILFLSYNKLKGSIPHKLGQIFNLQYLILSENQLSGDIPVEIYNISSIQVFVISYNQLTGQFPNNLGLMLPNMLQFVIGENNFSGSIPTTLANASNLAQIEIGVNMLTGLIPRNLGRLQKLHTLFFESNPLGIDKNNDISFITTLTNCTNLVKLDLSVIEIEGVLPVSISNLSKKLTFLGLADNHISGSLLSGIGDLDGLNFFSVSGNTLSDSIPLTIGKLINMKELYLYENKFIGEIPPSIGDISGLLHLSIYQNKLTGSIPLSLSNCTNLQALDLSINNLSGSLPKELFSITSLSLGLSLAQNKFTGSLPSEVGNLKNLVWLSVSENELSGEIPISIGKCQMLLHLEMEGNLLDGLIPSSLGQLISIEFLDLSLNKFSGEIPAFMEKLKHLSFLNLSFNMLEGKVPTNGVFTNASALSIVGNENLCGGIESLNLHGCPTSNSKIYRKLLPLIIIIIVICTPLSLLLLFRCTYENYQRKYGEVSRSTYQYDKQFLKISYAEIMTSTNGFSSENLIGNGKYGSVYRGVLKPNDKLIAVKVLKLELKGAHESFLAECKTLRNIRHRNLVKIITACSSIDLMNNDFKALILEYVPKGSLEEWLHQNPFVHDIEKKLNFLERLNIAIDIATALDYLHNQSGNPIVHCDIKPSNILLGNDLRGLVSDFGLAKFLPMATDKSLDIESSSIGIRGTIGYVAPEYGMGGDVSAKGDIYSYGILLLEIFTGKRPTDTMFTEDISLHTYVKTALPDRVAEIIDPRILMVHDNVDNISNYTSERVGPCCLSIFRVGVSCSSMMKNDRMDINDVLFELQHVRNDLEYLMHG